MDDEVWEQQRESIEGRRVRATPGAAKLPQRLAAAAALMLLEGCSLATLPQDRPASPLPASTHSVINRANPAPQPLTSAPPVSAVASPHSKEDAIESSPPHGPAQVAWRLVPVDHVDDYQLAAMPDGGVLMLGHNEWNISSREDMVLLRLDAGGETVWQRFGTGRLVRALASNGAHAFLATEFSGRVLFDSVREAGPGGVDVFVGKIDLAGSAEWGHVFSTYDFDRVTAIAPTPDGGVAAAQGVFVAPRSGPFAFKIAGGQDAIVTRWTSSGELEWVKNLAWPGYDEAAAIVADAEGGTIVAGTRWRSPSMSDADRANHPSHGFVVRLHPNGDPDWVREFAVPDGRLSISHLASREGAFAMGGRLLGRVNFGSTTLDAPRGAAFVALLDPTGEVAWARTVPSYSCLAVDDDGRFLLVGSGGISILSPSFEPISLMKFEQGMRHIHDCAGFGSDALYVSGRADPSLALGGEPLPAPRLVRFRHLPAYSVSYVMKVTY